MWLRMSLPISYFALVHVLLSAILLDGINIISHASILRVASQRDAKQIYYRLATLSDTSCSTEGIVKTVFEDSNCENNENYGESGSKNLVPKCVLDIALKHCYEVDPSDGCSGFVIKKIDGVTKDNLRIDIFNSDGYPLRTQKDAILFERRAVLDDDVVLRERYAREDLENNQLAEERADSANEYEEIPILTDEESISNFVLDVLSDNKQLEMLEEEILVYASQSNAKKKTKFNLENERKNEERMLKSFAKAQEDVLKETLEKAGFASFHHQRKPLIVCHPGTLEGGGYEPGAYIAGKPSTYQPGFCKKPQRIRAKCDCDCTGPEIIPGFCVDAVYTPGTPPVVLPGKFIPKQYTPGYCTLFQKGEQPITLTGNDVYSP